MAASVSEEELEETITAWKENANPELVAWMEENDVGMFEGRLTKLLCMLEKSSVEDVITSYPTTTDLINASLSDRKLPKCGETILK